MDNLDWGNLWYHYHAENNKNTPVFLKSLKKTFMHFFMILCDLAVQFLSQQPVTFFAFSFVQFVGGRVLHA